MACSTHHQTKARNFQGDDGRLVPRRRRPVRRLSRCQSVAEAATLQLLLGFPLQTRDAASSGPDQRHRCCTASLSPSRRPVQPRDCHVAAVQDSQNQVERRRMMAGPTGHVLWMAPAGTEPARDTKAPQPLAPVSARELLAMRAVGDACTSIHWSSTDTGQSLTYLLVCTTVPYDVTNRPRGRAAPRAFIARVSTDQKDSSN